MGESLTLIISVLLMFVGFFGLLFADLDDDEKASKCFYTMSLIGIVVFIFFMIGTYKLSTTDWVKDKEPYATERITALGDNNLTNGEIYARRGYIEESLYYQYMVKVGGGGYKANKVKASGATVYYDDENYRVERYKKHRS